MSMFSGTDSTKWKTQCTLHKIGIIHASPHFFPLTTTESRAIQGQIQRGTGGPDPLGKITKM